MLKCKKIVLAIFTILAFSVISYAVRVTPNTKISLITCGAGYEVYSMYGHTALRIQDSVIGYDYVINYGMFSMAADNFAYHFVKGETDYQVVAESFESFIEEYITDNRYVFQTELNIPDSSKIAINDFLEWNLRPENKVYRYKFFSDNCATRIRNILEEKAHVVWNETNINRAQFPSTSEFASVIQDYWQKKTAYTFRDIILIYQSKIPWINEAIQMPIAAPADTHLTYRAVMFLPDFLLDAVQNAHITYNNKVIPLAKSTKQLVFTDKYKIPQSLSWFERPQFIMPLFLCLVFIVSIWGIKRGRLYCFTDFLLMFISGLLGVFLFFMSFISVHECMFPNYNLLWAFPLNFIAAFAVLLSHKCLKYYYRFLIYLYVFFFIVIPFLPQHFLFVWMTIPIAILVRIASYYIVQTKKQ